jgi:hypothetical protein
LDFRITKTSKGGYADYNTSTWARKESALTETEQTAIEAHGLFDLSTFLPKKPGDVEMRVIKEMFEASVDGQPYDTARWGQYFRPAGVQAPAGSAPAVDDEVVVPVARTATPVPSASNWEDDAAEAASAPIATPKPAQKAEDILAMIRSRQKQ